MFQKTCPYCGFAWNDREAFLADKRVQLIGYQPCFTAIAEGLLLFNHNAPQCGTSFAIEVNDMLDLYDGPVFHASLHGTNRCGRHCLNVKDLHGCDKPCQNARVREVMNLILRKKADQPRNIEAQPNA